MTKRKKSALNLALTLAVVAVPSTIFADDSHLTNNAATESRISKNNSSDGSNVREARSFITHDTYINAPQTVGGIGKSYYSHYGNFKYNGRAHLENTGSRSFDYKFFAPTGIVIFSGSLAPGKNVQLDLLQSIVKWDLADGEGKVTISTKDGGTGQAYLRYNVLNGN